MNRLLFGDNLRGSSFNFNVLFKKSSGQASQPSSARSPTCGN
jgi:hypothetical protein